MARMEAVIAIDVEDGIPIMLWPQTNSVGSAAAAAAADLCSD
jgi:hypothetical protein